MKKIIVIIGATATSKTTLAKKLYEYLDVEIINADAFQMYQQLNIGINKPTKEEIQKYQMHLFNVVDINEPLDISVYQKMCNEAIEKIIKKNKIPIICGGSNLYIDAVIKGYHLNKTLSREEITYFDNWSYDDIYNYVLEKDPQEALKINKNNQKRIIRAAQIIYSLNQPKSNLDQQKNSYVYDCLIIETILDRQMLYEKINTRVEKMLEMGWENEVIQLLNHYPNFENLQAANALGYKEIIKAIKTNNPIPSELIKQKTRNYAKKQLTWNRNKYQNIIKFNMLNDDFNNLLNIINGFIKTKK